MNNISQQANQFYYDLQGMQAKRYQAAATEGANDEGLQQSAKQFEGLFTNMIVKSMRQASFGEGLFSNQQSEMFQSMLDQQYSQQLAQSGELGFAEDIVAQMQAIDGVQSSKIPSDTTATDAAPMRLSTREYNFMPLDNYRNGTLSAPDRFMPLTGNGRMMALNSSSAASKTTATEIPDNLSALVANLPKINMQVQAPESGRFASKQDFVDQLMPHARRAAARIGTDPKVLVAQAALETGWGKSLANKDGKSSYNLFGIKSQGNWQGDSMRVGTHEFYGGKATHIKDGFRAYSDFSQSFDDYANLITGLDRYDKAIKQGDNPERYAKALQSAGYATDPNYAKKIMQMYRSDEISGYVERPAKTFNNLG